MKRKSFKELGTPTAQADALPEQRMELSEEELYQRRSVITSGWRQRAMSAALQTRNRSRRRVRAAFAPRTARARCAPAKGATLWVSRGPAFCRPVGACGARGTVRPVCFAFDRVLVGHASVAVACWPRRSVCV